MVERKSERKKKREARGSGGRSAHLSPFLFGKKQKIKK